MSSWHSPHLLRGAGAGLPLSRAIPPNSSLPSEAVSRPRDEVVCAITERQTGPREAKRLASGHSACGQPGGSLTTSAFGFKHKACLFLSFYINKNLAVALV